MNGNGRSHALSVGIGCIYWELFEVEFIRQSYCAIEQYKKRIIDKQVHTVVISKKGYRSSASGKYSLFHTSRYNLDTPSSFSPDPILLLTHLLHLMQPDFHGTIEILDSVPNMEIDGFHRLLFFHNTP